MKGYRTIIYQVATVAAAITAVALVDLRTAMEPWLMLTVVGIDRAINIWLRSVTTTSVGQAE